jgi:hypothetical protein
MNRRTFLTGMAAGAALAERCPAETTPNRTYKGPNVIIVRFGGGVRRRETIASDETYAPFLKKVLAPQGVLFPKMEIASNPGIETSHGQGTLYILTGKYDRYEDVQHRFLGERFEAKVPTLFEAMRKAFNLPEHQSLIVNGEDRIDEEFFSFSNHHLFGVKYRSTVLSLYRFKLYLLRTDLATGRFKGAEKAAKRKELARLESLDHRARDAEPTTAALDRFWESWAAYYGRSGFVNPRGDRLLTELAIRAMRQLEPRLMMVNFNDPDYVHWGNKTHYTRGVSIVDDGLRQIYEASQVQPAYRDNTVFIIVPDCGRDSNPFMAVPFQHHLGSRSSHEIFLLAVGPGIDRGRIVDKLVEQNSVAATVAGLMDFSMPHAEGPALAEVFE